MQVRFVSRRGELAAYRESFNQVVLIFLLGATMSLREALNKSILLMVRQAHHERNQMLTVLPNLSKDLISDSLVDINRMFTH
jgi:hypothetical protein